MARVTMTYYVDVLSSWCLIAEDAIAKVRKEFGDALTFEWRIAQLREPFGYTHEQLAWYYRRTEAVTGTRLDPVWLTSTADGSVSANRAAEAARSLGVVDDRVRLAIARATMLDGKRGCDADVAADVAASASGLDAASLRREMDAPRTAERIRESSEAFAALRVEVRPTFVLKNGINDSAVLSGCWRHDVLRAAIAGLAADEDAYRKFVAESPPPQGAK